MTPAPSTVLPVCRHRRPLARSFRALVAGRLTVGFLGGSITTPKTGTRWPEAWIDRLGQRHPLVWPVIENAALGATGSDPAVFRAKDEIVERRCDLVFVEYSVSDYHQPPARRGRPAWCDESGWFHLTVIADDLPAGRHQLELETLPARRDDVHGTTTTLGLVGVIR